MAVELYCCPHNERPDPKRALARHTHRHPPKCTSPRCLSQSVWTQEGPPATTTRHRHTHRTSRCQQDREQHRRAPTQAHSRNSDNCIHRHPPTHPPHRPCNLPSTHLNLCVGHVGPILALEGPVLGCEEPKARLPVLVHNRVWDRHILGPAVQLILHPEVVEQVLDEPIALKGVRRHVGHGGVSGQRPRQ